MQGEFARVQENCTLLYSDYIMYAMFQIQRVIDWVGHSELQQQLQFGKVKGKYSRFV